MKRRYLLYKWLPLLTVLAVTGGIVSLFSLTDLRFYLAEKPDVFTHVLKTTAPAVTKREDWSFSYTFDPEEDSEPERGKTLFEDGDCGVRMVVRGPEGYHYGENAYAEGNVDMQYRLTLDFVGTVKKGVASVPAPFAFPPLESPFYQACGISDSPGGPALYYRTFTHEDHLGRGSAYRVPAENVTIAVGGETFHPKYIEISPWVENGEISLRVGMTFFDQPDDFARLVARPRTREITVTFDSLYLNEYRVNPIIGGILK
ncbi:hypothetical protein [Bittarella massiliensis (ex Durand et al. 2017)]|uniref:hypothetical protein n=1 Tax=Bittarella massiliensis (ex Durand et al. 2017) TaxID=1720313 RepID=UPI001AA1074E|nr:hypothetical protein [Bittarella massiliensis (ex Durand et al. 2017)]MBO1680544.1 hypothetical protein [Bittarella massiliensis (ex Durand et al. 2017)]